MKTQPDTAHTKTLPEAELRRRVIHSLMLPVVRLAKVFHIPLQDAQDLLQMAYFSELRSGGLKLQEIALRLGVSRRSAVRMSKQLKTNFFLPERDHELPRRILFMLMAEPMSRTRIVRELRDLEAQEVDEALHRLEMDGRIVRDDGGRVETFAITRAAERMVLPGWTARIGALNSLAGNVASVVYGRFFAHAPSAFARTLSFRIRVADLPRLQELYEQVIWPQLTKLEENVTDHEESIAMNLSLLWSPYNVVPSTSETQTEHEDISPSEG